ncbi:MAG: Gfo/Idh/MocA family oxidoreductase [Kiritimatiellaeota bacterium]|nr:Gfo/Idh/MocA family oxidoreductase [Kiritimatiellota bacterium]
MKQKVVTRRSFLAKAALGGAAASFSAQAGFPWFHVRKKGTDLRKLNIACVGCGGKGYSDIHGVASENIVALCDVDFGRASRVFQEFPDAKRYKDYRRMFEDLDKDIDAVVVSTPDHMHFPVAMMAIEMGKHAFVQKPLTHTVWEARELAKAAKKRGVATQMGNQGHANEGTRLMYEWVRSGALGPVREVHLYTDRPIWPQGLERPPKAEPVPPLLEWDLWLGIAPKRPYHSGYHPFAWRGWWDFGCGALGDMGCHIMDATFWALDLRAPEWIEAESDAKNADTTPKWSVITYQFPARGKMPPVKVVWYDGGKKPPRPAELEEGRNIPNGNGQIVIGEKAAIMASCYCSSIRIIPEKKMREIGKPPRMLDRVKGGHYQEWIRACKGGKPAGSNFPDHAGPLTEMVLLGNVAVRAGKRVAWDDRRLRCANAPEADRFIREPFRVF